MRKKSSILVPVEPVAEPIGEIPPSGNFFYVKKPVMSPALEAAAAATVAQYLHPDRWQAWGMTEVRNQGSCVLLHGPPGCGKTSMALWLASLLEKPLLQLNLARFGSGVPGENERQLEAIFAESLQDQKTIFIDECDSILWDRNDAGGDQLWMVGVINALLTCIGSYPYLILLASNRKHALDPALARRIIGKIKVPRPGLKERERLWVEKIPAQHPLKLTTPQLRKLADLPLNGAEIETAVIIETQRALLEKREPAFETLFACAQESGDTRVKSKITDISHMV